MKKNYFSTIWRILKYTGIFLVILCLVLILIFRLSFNGRQPIVDRHHENKPQHWFGNKTICLLIHGFASGPQEMKFLGEYLKEKGFSVQSLLLAGHNQNPAALKDIQWENWEQQVRFEIESMKQQNYENIVVIGFSLGGLLALRTSLMPPVDGIIAISPCLYIFDKSLYFIPLKLILKITAPLVPFIFRKANRKYYYQGQVFDRLIYDEIPVNAVGQLLMLADSTSSILDKIEKPLLLIQARNDKTVDPVSSEIIAHSVKSRNKKIMVLPKGGHLIVLNDARDQVFQEVYEFIKGIQFNEK